MRTGSPLAHSLRLNGAAGSLPSFEASAQNDRLREPLFPEPSRKTSGACVARSGTVNNREPVPRPGGFYLELVALDWEGASNFHAAGSPGFR